MKQKTNALGVMTFFLTRSFLFLGLFSTILKESGTNAIFSLLIGGVIGLFVILFFDLLLKKLNDEGLFSVMKKIFPSWFFYFLKFSLLLFFLYLLANFTSKSVSFINYHYLNQYTPFIILFTFLLLLFYIGSKSIETIKKISLILAICIAMIYLFSILGTIYYVDIDQLKPLSFLGANHLVKSSLQVAICCALPNVLTLFFYQKKEKQQRKHLLIGYVLGILSITIEFILILGVLGVSLVEIYPYPEIAMLKKISFLDVFERVEILLSIGWLMESIIIAMIMAKIFLGELTSGKKKKARRILYFITFIITFILIYKINTYPYMLFLFLIFGLGIPILVFLQQKFTKKKEELFFKI